MTPTRVCAFAVTAALLCSSAAVGQPGPEESLPLKRVRLYETGVGYFERTGKLHNGSGVGLPVPAGHLDDALKTLVVLNTNGKTTVSGIEFGSSVSRSMGRALAGLPADDEAPLGLNAILRSLKGAKVELRAQGKTFRGRLIDVLGREQSDLEACARVVGEQNGKPGGQAGQNGKPCSLRKQTAVLLLTDRSEIRRFAALDVTSVRPLDSGARSRLGSALDAVSRRGSQTRRALNVMAKGGKSVTLGYVAEAPVWRSNYRLVLDTNDQAALQGWALVHNDTDEDWKQVRVELVNGQPDSFLFPLAAPRYARRELVTPENPLSTVPQLLDTPVDEMWATGAWGEGSGYGVGLSGIGEGGGGRGEGIGLGSVGTLGYGTGAGRVRSGQSSVLSVGSLASLAQAEGVEAGALFRYALASPVDLRAHGSALVPFVQETVKARRIAWFRKPGAQARSAVHVTNETTQTLPPGTIAVFADGGFAGESALDRLKPSESRIVRFGVDLDVELTTSKKKHVDVPQVLTVHGGTLVEHFLRKHELVYELVNKSGAARTVYLQLDFVDNARVKGASELGYDADKGRALAVFQIEARKQRKPTLRVEEGLSRSHLIASLTSDRLRKLAGISTMHPAQRPILRQAAKLLAEADSRGTAITGYEHRLKELDQEVKGLRLNLRALKTARSGAAREMAERLLRAEDRRKTYRARIGQLKAEASKLKTRAHLELAKLDQAAKKPRKK